MIKRKKTKKYTYTKAKPIGLGIILLVVIVAIVSSFHPKIESMPTNVDAAESIQWPQDAPKIDLVIQNNTQQRIEVRLNNTVIGHINSLRQGIVPMFNSETQLDNDGEEWEVSELYKFVAPGNRHISLNPSLFVLKDNLLLSHPYYINLRSASLSGGQEIKPRKNYRLTFTIQGNKFEESTVDLKELN